jgi:hypothetical protein
MPMISTPTSPPAAATRSNSADVAVAVRAYAQKLGCDDSNIRAAIAWALRAPGHTLQAIREGRNRADQLRARQPLTTS